MPKSVTESTYSEISRSSTLTGSITTAVSTTGEASLAVSAFDVAVVVPVVVSVDVTELVRVEVTEVIGVLVTEVVGVDVSDVDPVVVRDVVTEVCSVDVSVVLTEDVCVVVSVAKRPLLVAIAPHRALPCLPCPSQSNSHHSTRAPWWTPACILKPL